MRLQSFVLLIALLYPSIALAGTDNTELKIEVLPLDCVFEVINDGSNTIRYLTPEECGQIADPSPGSTDETGQSTPVAPVFRYRPNRIQDTAPTIVDNGDQVIGLPHPPSQPSQPVKARNKKGIPLFAALTAAVLVTFALVFDTIFNFGLQRLVGRLFLSARKIISFVISLLRQ